MTDEREVVHELSVEGLRYSYRILRQEAPRTEPVLVLGGVLQDKYGWQQFDEAVGPLTSLITLDLPGAGTADPLRPDQGVETLCRAVEQVIDHAGLPRVNLFGYSFGSAIAFAFAQRRPYRIARLLLGGVPAHITDAQLAAWRRATARMAAGAPEEFVDQAVRLWLCQDQSLPVRHRVLVNRYVRRLVRQAIEGIPHGFALLDRSATEELNPSGGLRGVDALVFCGEHDTVSPAERQRAFAATIEGSRFVTIAESDHWVALERARDVTDLVVRYFTDQPLATADYLAEPAGAGCG